MGARDGLAPAQPASAVGEAPHSLRHSLRLGRRGSHSARPLATGLALDVLRHGDGLLLGLLHRADHVESLLGQVVVRAGEQPLEAGDRLLERDELARLAC